MLVVRTTNPLVTTPYDDADEARYGELPVAKQLEIREAADPVGTGAIVETRVSTADIREAERIGRVLDELDALTGWAVDSGPATIALVASAPAGLTGSSIRMTVGALGANASTRMVKTFALDLSEYSGGTPIGLHIRASSITNVARFELLVETSAGVFFTVNLGLPTAANAWQFRGLARALATAAGAPTWETVTKLYVRVFADATGWSVAKTFDFRQVRLGSLLAFESAYDIQGGYRDAATPAQPFAVSGWATVKPSQPPGVTAVAPADGAVVTIPKQTLELGYSSPSGKPQRDSDWMLYEVVDGVDQERHRSGTVDGAGVTYRLPASVLESGKTYAWVPAATDIDALRTEGPRWTFTTAFTQPPAPTGLIATPARVFSAVDLAWDASTLSDDEFDYWAIEYADIGEFRRIATIYDKTALGYSFDGAMLEMESRFRLVQGTGAIESSAADATARLSTVTPGASVIKVAGSTRLIAEVMDLEGLSRQRQARAEVFEPPGADYPTVLKWGLGSSRGTIRFRVRRDDWDLIPLIEAMAEDTSSEVLIKAPYQFVVRSTLMSFSDDAAADGDRMCAADYIRIAT